MTKNLCEGQWKQFYLAEHQRWNACTTKYLEACYCKTPRCHFNEHAAFSKV